jgi:hypothetical protein
VCDLGGSFGESLILCRLYQSLAVSIVVGGALYPAVVVPYPKIAGRRVAGGACFPMVDLSAGQIKMVKVEYRCMKGPEPSRRIEKGALRGALLSWTRSQGPYASNCLEENSGPTRVYLLIPLLSS